jgi:two-component system sensor kinase FixL
MDAHVGVLVVDDDADTRANLRDILELDDYRVKTAGSVAELFQQKDWSNIVAVILDRRLPDGTAEDVLPHLHRLVPDVPVIIVTGYADVESTIAALRLGAADYILKPVNPEELRNRLGRITEQRRSEQRLATSRRRLQMLFDNTQDAILLADDQGRYIDANPAACDLTGYTREELLRLTAEELTAPAHRDDARQHWQAFLRAGKQGGDCLLRHKDGHIISVEYRAVAHIEPGIHLSVLRDMTERKQSEQKLLQAERLAAIGQMMTVLAHESGNALARSHACLEMLAWEVEDRPEAMELIGRIQKAQDHLQHLYEEVRNYAAPLKLDRDVWNLAMIWRQAWDNLAVARQGREASLQEQVAGVNLDRAVDQFRLGQVFRNILENALAACADPVQIVIECAEMEVGGRPGVRIAVRDNGPGLTPEQKQRIFEPFYSTKAKGTGLGMAIAKRIVEAHGGNIAVGESNGSGAAFLISLPREPS